MIKESEPIRTQERQSSDKTSIAAAENTVEGGKSLPAAQYNPQGGNSSGAEYVQQLQQGLGTSLKDTKVVKNSPKAKAVGEDAFAQGNQIHFAPGKYQPDTKSGQDMLGHEIVHTVQQKKGKVNATGQVGSTPVNTDKSLENQATKESTSLSKGNQADSSLQGASQSASGPGVAQGFLGGFMKKVGSVVSKVGGGIKNVAKSVGSGIANGAKAVGGAVKSGATGFLGGVKNLANKGINAASGVLGKVGGVASGIFSKGKDFLGNAVNAGKGLLGKIGGFAGNLLNKGKDAATGVFDKIKQGGGFLKGIIEDGGTWLKEKVNQGLDAAGAISAYIGKKIKSTGTKVWDGIRKVASDPAGALSDIVEGIVSKGSSTWSWIKGAGSNLFDKAKGVFNKIKKFAKKGGNYLKNLGGNLVGMIKNVGGNVFSGFKNILSGNFLDGLKDFGSGIGNVLSFGINGFLDATGGLFDSFLGPEGKEVEAGAVPTRHVMDEFTAHRIAYKDAASLANGSGISPKEREILEKGGYDPDNILVRTGPNGFQAVLIMPANGDVTPMLAIRGTADLGGALTDIDPKQVGDYQFQNNRVAIEEMIAAAGGRVDLSGHSLGGAMAQIVAANYTSSVNRLTTFQSPGVSSETAAMYKNNIANMNENDRPEVAHHIIKNDLVSKAGEENLPGTFYEHDLGNIDPITAHTSYMSASDDFETARDEYGISNDYLENEIGKEVRDSSKITQFEEQPHKYKRLLAEFVRGGVGDIRDGAVGGWNSLVSGAKNLYGKAKMGLFKGKKLIEGLFGIAKKKGKSALSKFKKLFSSFSR